MDGTIWLEIMIAALAVIGLYSVLHWILGRIVGARNIIVAIEIMTQRDAESAEVLIRDALFRYLSLGAENLVILTTEEWFDHPELCRSSKKYGIARIITENISEDRS